MPTASRMLKGSVLEESHDLHEATRKLKHANVGRLRLFDPKKSQPPRGCEVLDTYYTHKPEMVNSIWGSKRRLEVHESVIRIVFWFMTSRLDIIQTVVL